MNKKVLQWIQGLFEKVKRENGMNQLCRGAEWFYCWV